MDINNLDLNSYINSNDFNNIDINNISDLITKISSNNITEKIIIYGLFLIIIISIISIFKIIFKMFIFKKANKPMWAAYIPVYKDYILYEMTWGNGWYFLLNLLNLIPLLGSIAVLIIKIITKLKLAKVFNKDEGFAVGLIFLDLIFTGILAFDSSIYTSPIKEVSN